jgi:hypothetical protein
MFYSNNNNRIQQRRQEVTVVARAARDRNRRESMHARTRSSFSAAVSSPARALSPSTYTTVLRFLRRNSSAVCAAGPRLPIPARSVCHRSRTTCALSRCPRNTTLWSNCSPPCECVPRWENWFPESDGTVIKSIRFFLTGIGVRGRSTTVFKRVENRSDIFQNKCLFQCLTLSEQ